MRRVRKSVIHAAAGALLLIATLGLGGCEKPKDPADAARGFFELIAAGKAEEAYQSSSFAFRAQRSLKAFETHIKEHQLSRFVTARWEEPTFEGRTARLRGEIVTNAGKSTELLITLNQESGDWRIYSIRTPRDQQTGTAANLFGSIGKTSEFTEAVDRPLPDADEVRAMTLETLLEFNDAVQQKSFKDFHRYVSKAWQKQLTVGQLNRAFQPFIDNGVNFAGIKDLTPIYDSEPYVTSEGLLSISGHYPTTPYRVIFSLRYIYELPKWRLFGIDMTLRK